MFTHILKSILLGFISLLVVSVVSIPPLQNKEEYKLFTPSTARVPKKINSQLFQHHGKELESNWTSTYLLPEYKLPQTVIPFHYDLTIAPLLDNDTDVGDQYTAPGKIVISMDCYEAASNITLHAKLLSVDNSTIAVRSLNQPTTVIQIVNIQEDTLQHFLIIELANPLEVGQKYEVYIEFVASISKQSLYGIYVSSYTDPEGIEKRLAVTQFQSVFARQAFPCFDEPSFKAEFDITIIHKGNYTSISNMDIASTQPAVGYPSGWLADKFDRTLKMSTYLVAFIVSDFQHVTADKDLFNGKPVRIFATPDDISKGGGDYAAKTTAKMLMFYEDYFGVEYPLTKLDSAAIPDFDAGGMENWGLVNYYHRAVLNFYGKTTEYDRFNIDGIISHEVAHMWFGNIVTCKWWSEIWLNEGFATYGSYLGHEAVHPEFEARKRSLNEAFQTSMIADAGSRSHPLINDAITPDEIERYFSPISYEKGGSVVIMMEAFLSKETFRKGLSKYLQTMSFKNVVQDDLFQILNEVALEDNRLPSNITMKDIMDTWTLQSGFPLVRVNRVSPSRVLISQEKFVNTIDAEEERQLSDSDLWFVPITVVSKNKPTLVNHIPEMWLENVTSKSIDIDTSDDSWMMINQDATGYYRVLYDDYLSRLIQLQLEENATVISPLSRSQLLDDYFTFAFQEIISFEQTLNMTRYMTQESDFTVWEVIFAKMRITFIMFSTTSSFPSFQKYFFPRLEFALTSIGVEQLPEHTGMSVILRRKLLDWACTMEHPICTSYAKKLFQQWKNTPEINPVPIDIRAVMYCTIVAAGGQEEFEFTFARYQEEAIKNLNESTSSRHRERKYLLKAMACSAEETILNNILEMTLDTASGILVDDATEVIQNVAANSKGRHLAFEFIQDKKDEIVLTIGSGRMKPIADVVYTLSEYFNTESDLDAIELFILEDVLEEQLLDPTINDALDFETSLNTIEENINWMSKYFEAMERWFEEQ